MKMAFPFQIKFKYGKQRNWRDVCRMGDYEAAIEHAKQMRSQLAKDYRVDESSVKMAVLKDNKILIEL